MNLTYSLLTLSVVIALAMKDRRFLFISIILVTVVGFYDNVVTLTGVLGLSGLSLVTYAYFTYRVAHPAIRFSLFLTTFILLAYFSLNLFPGFHNAHVLDNIQMSPQSCPFSMYLNFDRVMAGLIVYALSPLSIDTKTFDFMAFKQTTFILMLCVATILTPALLSGFVQIDLKLPEVFLIWTLNNFFFECFREEVIFRGFLQNTLRSVFSNGAVNRYLHILIASMIFGLAHFKGGLVYVMLASICGFFYGYTYDKTNRILCAMIVHFGLNLVHLLLFTYPASIHMCR